VGSVAAVAGVIAAIVFGVIPLVQGRREARLRAAEDAPRRRVVQIEVRVFYRPTEGGYVVGVNIAATNLSERTVGLRQWLIEDAAGKPLLAGSPHEGNVGTMLQPHQLHGWNIEPEVLQTAQLQPPVRVVVTLTTGERMEAGLTSW